MQHNLETLQANGIAPFAISPDPQDLLRRFSEKFAVTYPLLSDVDSRVIREFGIFNEHIPEDHPWFGIPYPGTFMIDKDGRVFDRTFFADHMVRESVNDMLQGSYRIVDLERGEIQTLVTSHLEARVYFSSPTVRPAQRTVLTIEIELAEGMHVYGRPLPDGYIPVEVSVEGGEVLELVEVEYPVAKELGFEVIGETLPAYEGRLALKAHCLGRAREKQHARIRVQLRYQACDKHECYLPQTLDFDLPLEVLPHDWEQLDA